MLVRRAVGVEVDVCFDMAADLWSCRVDPNQLESAILNLGDQCTACDAEGRQTDDCDRK